MMISDKWIWLVALIFFLKALLLSFWITPLWDVPDETGHFSYARDIGKGYGFPVLGKATHEADVKRAVRGYDIQVTKWNYITQHPPAYYIPAALVWKVATIFTDDPEILFRAPRILSALAGALTLVVLYFLLGLLTTNRWACLGFAACIGFIPMFSHMSSGTNHDITLTLITSIATYYWTKFLIYGKDMKNACYAAIWLSVACFTKLTALVLTVPMLAIIMFELESPWKLRIKQVFVIVGLWLTLPGYWMLRSYYHYGQFLVTKVNYIGGFRLENNPLTDSFYAYLTSHSSVEYFFIHFFGLFGWIGTCKGVCFMHGVNSWPLQFYSIIVMGLLLMVVLYISSFIISGKEIGLKKRDPVFGVVSDYLSRYTNKISFKLTIGAIGLAGAIIAWFISTPSLFRHISFSMLTFILIVSFLMIFFRRDEKLRLLTFAWAAVAFFAVVLLYQVYHFYLQSGELKAVHGRYLFPLIPLMMIGIFIPLNAIFKKYASQLFIILALLMAYTEMNVYFAQAITYYMTAGW